MNSRYKNIIVFGASGAIGDALSRYYVDNATLTTVSRTALSPLNTTHAHFCINILDEHNFDANLISLKERGPYDLVIVAIGTLHSSKYSPEKALSQLQSEAFHSVMEINTLAPALVMQRMLPLMDKSSPSVFAALSARVGSIQDNQLGGWYAYRASKAALNMLIKTAAIETKRRSKQSAIIGLHPGTVDSALSAPFQKNVPEHKLFSPSQSAEHLAQVLANITVDDTGKLFAWDGKEIPA